MSARRMWVAAVGAAALVVTMMPAQAQEPPAALQVFGVAVVEGPGTITSAGKPPDAGGTTYNEADPLWQACKSALEAAPDPDNQLPAALNGGVFFPCFGPPITFATTHFKGEGTASPDPVNAGSFCASTLGPCLSESTGTITGNIAGGVQAGAYCGSSRGVADGTFQTLNPPDSPLGNTSYTYHVEWAQSGATILPLVGEITSGPSQGAVIAGFVSSRTTNDSRGTCGRPSTSQPASAQVTFAVDGMTVSFDPAP